jgi:acyl-CoA-binding protein
MRLHILAIHPHCLMCQTQRNLRSIILWLITSYPDLCVQLYGLFKYVTVSRSPDSVRPSIFDMAGRAKWDAWSLAGQKYSNPKEAESKYIELARSLGWSGVRSIPQPSERREETENDIWDPEDITSRKEGLGMRMSTMAPEDTAQLQKEGLHYLAIENNVDALKALLDQQPNDIDGKDEFVGIFPNCTL